MVKYTAKRLAIVVSHPIQYFSPLFKELSKEIELKVFYAFHPSPEQQGKDGFNKAFQWDIDLFDGYNYEFMVNVAKEPSTSYKKGCDTPEIGTSLSKYGATHVVVFGWQLKTYTQTVTYCKRNSIPVAVRGDSQFDPEQSLLKKWVKQLYYPFFLKRFDYFLSVGKRNRSYLKRFGIKDHQIIFSPHAVDQQFWSGKTLRSDQVVVFLWVAKFISKKRPLDVIEAFKKACLKDKSIRLKMIGTGELIKKCKIEAKGISNIEFLGFKNQKVLRKEYLNSNTLILTSDYKETWGLVVNEIFSCGLPVIVSSACGCSPDLVNERTGIIYTYKNIAELTDAILQMSSMQKDKIDFKPAIQEINKIYSFERNVQSFMSFMDKS